MGHGGTPIVYNSSSRLARDPNNPKSGASSGHGMGHQWEKEQVNVWCDNEAMVVCRYSRAPHIMHLLRRPTAKLG